MTEQIVYVYAFCAMTSITLMGIAEIQDQDTVAGKAKTIAFSWAISLSVMVFAPYNFTLFLLAIAFTLSGSLAYVAIVYIPKHAYKSTVIFAISVLAQLVIVYIGESSIPEKATVSIVPLVWLLAFYGRLVPIVSTTANGMFDYAAMGHKAIF